MEYEIRNKFGEPLLMRNGLPFRYTTEWTAKIGVKVLKPKTPRKQRPIYITPV